MIPNGDNMSEIWLKMSACELGRDIETGKIDPVALAHTYLSAIEESPFKDQIFALVTEERALAEAEAAALRARSGQRKSLLDGVPISWKDLFDSQGDLTEAGSALLAGRRADGDARVLKNATEAGLVCLGKTHMSELAFSGLGYNPITQTPPNINNHACLPGGSSSGAAASVAFDLSAAGIGSDTGGSVRIPSAWNDLVGLKTTHGILSLEGVVPLCEDFDTVGPLCRSVEDASALFDVMQGNAIETIKDRPLNGMKFLNLLGITEDGLESGPAKAHEMALKKLSAAGASIKDGTIDAASQALELSSCLYTVSAYAQWREVIEAAPEKMFVEILERFRGGAQFSGVDYLQSWRKLIELRKVFLIETMVYDAILLPTSPILPPLVNDIAEQTDSYVTANLYALRNTRIGNMMGLCSTSLPTQTPSCGLMVITPALQERRLIEISKAIEAVI